MAFRARKVFGSFEKRTPDLNFSGPSCCCLSSDKKNCDDKIQSSYFLVYFRIRARAC